MRQIDGLKAVLEYFEKNYSEIIREVSYCEGRTFGTNNYLFLRFEITFEVELTPFDITTDFVRISVVDENGQIRVIEG